MYSPHRGTDSERHSLSINVQFLVYHFTAKSIDSNIELIISFWAGSISLVKAAILDLFSFKMCSPCCHFNWKGNNTALTSK